MSLTVDYTIFITHIISKFTKDWIICLTTMLSRLGHIVKQWIWKLAHFLLLISTAVFMNKSLAIEGLPRGTPPPLPHHFKHYGGLHDTALGYTVFRGGGRTWWFWVGGSMAHVIFLCGQWSTCLPLAGLIPGGTGCPDRSVILGRPVD